ncbi:MAG: hypothetical protein ABW084_13120 [Candidatus Thiodiazotropha sp.]
MNSEFFNHWEKQIFGSLEELYEASNLENTEIDIFNTYKHLCEYWLLRAKIQFTQSFNDKPNFIQNLARVLINLQSKRVTGPKDHLVKEMFSGKAVHREISSNKGNRIKINSNKVFNTYFELEILSFFLENGFQIELKSSKTKGKKIPEFTAIKDNIRINVEAKNLDGDKIMDHIFGDSFIEGIDYRPKDEDSAKGYKKIKEMLVSNYENAIRKFHFIPKNEYFILFMSTDVEISYLGSDAIEYLNNLPLSWSDCDFENFIGLILPVIDQTYVIQNRRCNLVMHKYIPNILNFNRYSPSIIES